MSPGTSHRYPSQEPGPKRGPGPIVTTEQWWMACGVAVVGIALVVAAYALVNGFWPRWVVAVFASAIMTATIRAVVRRRG